MTVAELFTLRPSTIRHGTFRTFGAAPFPRSLHGATSSAGVLLSSAPLILSYLLWKTVFIIARMPFAVNWRNCFFAVSSLIYFNVYIVSIYTEHLFCYNIVTLLIE